MSKTAEELAYEYGEKFDGVEISKNDINIAWYEGYKAAQKEYEAKIQELETQLENWQHDAIHGDEGL